MSLPSTMSFFLYFCILSFCLSVFRPSCLSVSTERGKKHWRILLYVRHSTNRGRKGTRVSQRADWDILQWCSVGNIDVCNFLLPFCFCGFWSDRTLHFFPLSSVRSSVRGVTYQLFSIFWRFIPWKPYIFWTECISSRLVVLAALTTWTTHTTWTTWVTLITWINWTT